MKAATIVAIVSAALVATTAGHAQTPAGTGRGAGQSTSGEAAAIKQVADNYVKAALAGDANGIAALYTEDAIEMPPNQPMLKGRTAIQQYYVKLFSDGTKMTSFTLDHIETQSSADNGWDVGTYRQTMQGEAAATAPTSDTGKYVVLLKRVGGSWKVAYAIYNSDMAPQTAR